MLALDVRQLDGGEEGGFQGWRRNSREALGLKNAACIGLPKSSIGSLGSEEEMSTW